MGEPNAVNGLYPEHADVADEAVLDLSFEVLSTFFGEVLAERLPNIRSSASLSRNVRMSSFEAHGNLRRWVSGSGAWWYARGIDKDPRECGNEWGCGSNEAKNCGK